LAKSSANELENQMERKEEYVSMKFSYFSKERTWIIFLFIMAFSGAVFCFLPWAVDWFVLNFYSPIPDNLEYNNMDVGMMHYELCFIDS
jgi:hypothetical protein